MAATCSIDCRSIIDIATINEIVQMLFALEDDTMTDLVSGRCNRLVEHRLIGHDAGGFDAA
ncbi:hypothetical protein D3C79_1089520 [compost metagenome]